MTDAPPNFPDPAATRAAFAAQRAQAAGFGFPIGFLSICVVLALVLSAGWMLYRARWEYHTVRVQAAGAGTVATAREGLGAMRFASVLPSDAQLDSLGALGWELTTSYLEMETAWPNFGNSSYVTGMQPNVRPQDVVLIFRRRRLGRVHF